MPDIEYNIFKMERMLDERRFYHNNISVIKRLGGIPFIDSVKLFKLSDHTYPCWSFHLIFVLKIVDELIYCDKKKILFRKFKGE